MRAHSAPADRPRRRLALLTGAVAALTLAAVAAVTGLTSPPDGPDARPAQVLTGEQARIADALPWPEDGQAAVEAEGLGSLGTSGEQRPMPIASLTKVMTAWVLLRGHPLASGEDGPEITVDATAANESWNPDESAVPVREGDAFSQRELLEMMLVPSGNNIARLLARWDAGGEEAFVARMNEAAEELGMADTTYTSASGYAASTVSTAADQLILARHAMTEPAFREVVATERITVPGNPRRFDNTNDLLGADGVIGIKTGSSTPAGGALMWAARAPGDGPLILGVVLHQEAGTTPARGSAAAAEAGRALVRAAREALAGHRAA
ncbi:D-alanyl-D-alanine carboxypeptidase [Streptomyces sp. DSM 44917]|uniref:D-alanyl-D-alanine carboxypeptidase n=1 Tax=Streptomyces boetiae TaxID=3075541 RepID=A0ABU2L4E7_9ACTN|nr:D-alanyl-D-alanine carboxypeptidase [Streptomyces sp. DSM 44917]MDT0306405.1 D-alanyl-D-alanine carboxypeptidase [Streptomyces sp. DSM 44917]